VPGRLGWARCVYATCQASILASAASPQDDATVTSLEQVAIDDLLA
jgi:hypothetical protein